MKQLTTCLFAFYMLNSIAQTGDNGCYEIPHIHHFIPIEIGDFEWSTDELNELLTDEKITRIRSARKDSCNYSIPAILYQLTPYHNSCAQRTDWNRFELLVRLYCAERKKPETWVDLSKRDQTIDQLRDDYMSLLSDWHHISDMEFTFDDGPFIGEDYTESVPKVPSQVLSLNFGQIQIYQLDEFAVVRAIDTKDVVLWQKKITGLHGYPISKVTLNENYAEPVRYTSLTTKVYLYGGAEVLTLTLQPNGEFMYYHHSW